MSSTRRSAAQKVTTYREAHSDEEADFEDDVPDEDEEEAQSFPARGSSASGTRTSGRQRRASTKLNEYDSGDRWESDGAPKSEAPQPPGRPHVVKLRLRTTQPQRATRHTSVAGAVASSVHGDEDHDGEGNGDADGEADPAHATSHPAENPGGGGEDGAGRRRTRGTAPLNYAENLEESSEDEKVKPAGRKSNRRPKESGDDEFDASQADDYGTKKTDKKRFRTDTQQRQKKIQNIAKKRKTSDGDADFEDHSEESAEDDLNLHDDDSLDEPPASQGASYGLRQRKPVNYSIPLLGTGKRGNFDEIDPDTYNFPRKGPMTFVDDTPKKRAPRKKGGWNGLPATMSGKDYAKLFGDGQDSSDDDMPTARRVLGAGLGGGAMLGGMPTSISGLLGGAGGLGAFGGAAPAHGGVDKDAQMGRIRPASDGLADVDPFGPNMQVDFSSIGGLDNHVQQLKEMVSLPLLYPEVFTRFKVTPPRGVLFHGPPGTGKTLVARALAASCSTEGQQISFFMRKGADCLSKWVGEAERQLRLLFEEAKNSQPSIIFFDEIDGLAPVRSSKQDQIHASIVSTLLALMDGMDGRGQVVVIGATNRPDSVDPALRRPGRFDREFYFPLPDRKARRSILNIHTRGWEPPLSDEFKDRLAEVTKGYGGADLRALCTEAALNAVQRRYPQIYNTNERLLLKPETIHVDAKDFMMSVNKVVPSSKRAGTGSASALPEHFQPLLGSAVDEATRILDSVMPPVSKRNALEEALYEDEAPADTAAAGSSAAAAFDAGAATARARDGGFGRELLLQSFETLRVFKPRVLIHGEEGMGQGIVGAAILHHLEGYHIQPLDIATLLGDSSRSPEAAVIQIFQEAKRHKPSVMYIPSLIHWANSVPEGVRTTLKSLLDSLAPSDPVMLLAVAEEPIAHLRRDVRSWFGFLPSNKYQISRPTTAQRRAFFSDLLYHASRPPTEFPDGVPRRKRILEVLPVAPPKKPKEPTKAELDQMQNQDERTLEHLKFRLSPVLAELRKKFKRFCRDARLEYNLQNLLAKFDFEPPSGGKVVVHLIYNQPIKGIRGAQLISPAKPPAPAAIEGLIPPAPVPEAIVTDFSAGQQAQMMIGGPAATETMLAAASQLTLPSTTDGDVSMLNADLLVPDSQPLNPSLAITAEDAPPPSTPMRMMEGSQSLQVPAEANLAVPEAPSIPDGALKRDMTIWLISLDKMHTRLFNSYYLTAEEFLDDVQKLVSNAEEAAEVDEDRVTKAYEMRTLALILIEQFVDPAFRVECAKMAKRVREREAASAREEREKAGKGKEKANGDAAVNGEASSAPAASQEASTSTASLKRMREDVSGVSETQGATDEEAARKRQRHTPPPLGAAPMTPSSATHLSSNGAGSSSQPVQSAITHHGPIGMGSLLNGSNVTRSPSKALTHTFEINQSMLQALADHMVNLSSEFTIEQLEQLRASAFNVVWRRRSDWNRTALIQELWGLTQQISDAVRQEKELEEAEDD
ncbi:hypothetical protein CF326_g2005 [Tilletia indica]|nr:hypothetical protein CF326_g2005 [Tilletia indica]